MKPFNRKEVYYKVTNQEENHNGLQYKTGRVVDPLPFNDNPKDSCVPGGIYFTDKDHLLKFGAYGPWVRPLTIPKGVKVILDPGGDKFRAHEVEMIDRIPLEEFLKTVDLSRQGHVDLGRLTKFPEGVRFENRGNVYLRSLATLPEGARFENQGNVYLCSLTTLPEGVRFENRGNVYLGNLTTLPEGVRFGKGVQTVYLNRETTDKELGRLSTKHNIKFSRW